MAITANHFYWRLGQPWLLLCSDAAGFEFIRVPDGSVEKFAADPTGVLADLQNINLAPPFVQCQYEGSAWIAVEGYSTDGTPAHTQAVLLRRADGNRAEGGTKYIIVARSEIPTASIVPAGALG